MDYIKIIYKHFFCKKTEETPIVPFNMIEEYKTFTINGDLGKASFVKTNAFENRNCLCISSESYEFNETISYKLLENRMCESVLTPKVSRWRKFTIINNIYKIIKKWKIQSL